MVTSRKLTTDEEQFLKSKQIIPRTTTIAFDALALIVNNKNKDTLLRYNQIKDIFEGKITNWAADRSQKKFKAVEGGF